jgi:hypothetical protein
MEEPLEPIPSPPSHVLREFGHRALPAVVFAGAALATALLWNHRFAGSGPVDLAPVQAGNAESSGRTLVSSIGTPPFAAVTGNPSFGELRKGHVFPGRELLLIGQPPVP